LPLAILKWPFRPLTPNKAAKERNACGARVVLRFCFSFLHLCRSLSRR
jgi:hypothetical protein